MSSDPRDHTFPNPVRKDDMENSFNTAQGKLATEFVHTINDKLVEWSGKPLNVNVPKGLSDIWLERVIRYFEDAGWRVQEDEGGMRQNCSNTLMFE